MKAITRNTIGIVILFVTIFLTNNSFAQFDENYIVKDRNCLDIIVRGENKVEINSQIYSNDKIKGIVKSFMSTNPNDNPKPQLKQKQIKGLGTVNVSEGIVFFRHSYSNSSLASSEEIKVLAIIKEAFTELREEKAKKYFNKSYKHLEYVQKDAINEAVPVRVIGVDNYLQWLTKDPDFIKKKVEERCGSDNIVSKVNVTRQNSYKCDYIYVCDWWWEWNYYGFVVDVLDEYFISMDFDCGVYGTYWWDALIHMNATNGYNLKDIINHSFNDEYEEFEDEDVEEKVFSYAQEMPEYPGGSAKMEEFVKKNLRYPTKAIENGIQGKVFVGFIVEKDGSLSNFQIKRGIGGGCDEEALRIVKSMPKFKPGKQQGKEVRVEYLIRVIFELPENKK